MVIICGLCHHHEGIGRFRCSECGQFRAIARCRPEYCWISEFRMCRLCFNQLIAPLPFAHIEDVVKEIVMFLEGY